MALELNGTTGVSLVQDGVITNANLPAGSVLQVVQGSTNTEVSVTTGTYTDSGLSASITPSSSSSKILVIVNQNMVNDRDTTLVESALKLLRNTTDIIEWNDHVFRVDSGGATSVKHNGLWSFSYLDSPSTTSSTTYKIQGKPLSTADNGLVRFQWANQYSLITLMEIAG